MVHTLWEPVCEPIYVTVSNVWNYPTFLCLPSDQEYVRDQIVSDICHVRGKIIATHYRFCLKHVWEILHMLKSYSYFLFYELSIHILCLYSIKILVLINTEIFKNVLNKLQLFVILIAKIFTHLFYVFYLCLWYLCQESLLFLM